MAQISSPIAYPPSSSPPALLESRKRSFPDFNNDTPSKRHTASSNPIHAVQISHFSKHLNSQERASEHQQCPAPRLAGPFVDDEDSDDGNDAVTDTKSGLTNPPKLTPVTAKPERLATSRARTSSGKPFNIQSKRVHEPISFERLVAERSTSEPGRAKKSFYGVEIHELLDQAAQITKAEQTVPKRNNDITPSSQPKTVSRRGRDLLWTEKYRAKKYTDLVGDERTHRDVLRWIKGWDKVVFPGIPRPKPTRKNHEDEEPKPHRKILMLTGPPGLGKTTLAHVCARQAGYEVLEINASDERSRDVVKGKIKDCVGTDNVKTVNSKTDSVETRKSGKPFCVVVDEVDGVVGGSGGGGEGGFIKALIDLIALDQKNSTVLGSTSGNEVRKKGKTDRFRLLRPIILICNDVYHPSLRPLRSTNLAEIIHLRKPPLEKIALRLKSVLDKEGVACDSDGVRRLCEATWGVSDRREARPQSGGTGEGDIRSILVVGEWVASKLRMSKDHSARLSKKWVEECLLSSLSNGGEFARSIGRGGVKEAVDRVFQEGAGFARSDLIRPQTQHQSDEAIGDSQGVSEAIRRAATARLQEIINTSGDSDRILADCFTTYPLQPFQDDTFLSKPNAACEWLHFHDRISSKVHTGQEWELSPYLSQPILGFHHLFASSKQVQTNDVSRGNDDQDDEPSPFSGPRADYAASEALKQHKSILTGLQSALSIPLLRSFRSMEDISTDLLPHIMTMLTPNVKPVLIGGSGEQKGVVSIRKDSERTMIQRAVQIMGAVGVTFERARVDSGMGGTTSNYIYRMEPPLDDLATFDTFTKTGHIAAPVRYSIRQAMEQEYQKFLIKQTNDARQARYLAGGGGPDHSIDDVAPEASKLGSTKSGLGHDDGNTAKSMTAGNPKVDFFGRPIVEERPSSSKSVDGGNKNRSREGADGVDDEQEDKKAWVSYHEGFSNAVRKPITLDELLRSF